MSCATSGPLRSALIGLSVACAALLAPSFVRAEGWGDVAGQIVFEGEIPPAKELVRQGDPQVRDTAVCAEHGIPAEYLVVDPQTKGIADVFVYLDGRKLRANSIHPDLAKSAVPEVVCAVRGCRYVPHALVVRTDQKVRIRSDDPVPFILHSFPLLNMPANVLVAPAEPKGVFVEFELAERLPVEVKCDLHPWMSAYWLVVDHPYAAVTNSKGEFRIDKLPAGEHVFRVWRERAGDIVQTYKVTVKAGETTQLAPLAVRAEKFKD